MREVYSRSPRISGSSRFKRLCRIARRMLFALPIILLQPATAIALSEIKRNELSPLDNPQTVQPENEAREAIPLPNELKPPTESETQSEDAGGNLPEVLTDLNLLPAPARRMRELILEACNTGELEALRPLIGTGSQATHLSFGNPGGDPIEFLRDVSGDDEGQEILAILAEVLEAGFVRMDAGTPEEIYVWPYFFAYPLDQLDARQRVELFRIVTAGDYEDMRSFGGYNFYRAGITPEGHWAFFVAGD